MLRGRGFYVALAVSMIVGGPLALAEQREALGLIPMPASVRPGSGSLPIDRNFTVALTGYTEPRLDQAVDRFLRQIEKQTGIPG